MILLLSYLKLSKNPAFLTFNFYLSVTHPVDALDTDLAYLSKTPFVAFNGG